ncbi:hypothetical protein BC939DRAFT_527975 [Gamsiella multidivaricata]|uniref:uncharacterized protein n=1 Tax=Gamsiella multidivaricata TaxID=101098 RepID=UPI002220A238|nr:uncharacterized protein BC939DRAFT_527975 [Gamsiella multidivaricata]KAG0365994.1 hypothetical protein BGZ54_005958 [Gamsiella multidivaricata]KAI7825706.1 hypothetical protein BC939DRAFT_527975 [Gamsiella multidivaricata]
MLSGRRLQYALCLHRLPGLEAFHANLIRNVAGGPKRIVVVQGPREYQFRTLSTRKSTGRTTTKSSSSNGEAASASASSGRNRPPRSTKAAVPQDTPDSSSTTATSASVKPRKTATKSSKTTTSFIGDDVTTAATAAGIVHRAEIPDYKHSTIPPSQELDALQVLIEELSLTNSSLEKREILAQHADQAPLLGWIYDPLRQFHVTSARIIKYAVARTQRQDEAASSLTPGGIGEAVDFEKEDGLVTRMNHPDMSTRQRSEAKARATALGQGYTTLSQLLNALSTRAISGHTALDAILIFMERFCGNETITTTTGKSRSQGNGLSYGVRMEQLLTMPRSKVLMKILDKNLKAGCSVGMLREVFPTLIPGFYVALGHSLPTVEAAQPLFAKDEAAADSEAESGKAKSKAKKKKKVTTDSNVETDQVAEWYASRKLDGVRCLVRVDRLTGGIETISRNGKGFEGLTLIQDALHDVVRTRYSADQGGQEGWDGFFARALGLDGHSGAELPDQLIMDGEVCMFLTEPLHESPAAAVEDAQAAVDVKAVVVGGTDDGFGRENFLKAISFVRRGMTDEDDNAYFESSTNKDAEESLDLQGRGDRGDSTSGSSLGGTEMPVYCIFDCLTDKEFRERIGTRPFSQRIRGIADALSKVSQQKGGSVVGLMRVLQQTKIESFEQLQRMVNKGMKRGWEGVMLRKDIGYEGKRSRNLLKIKQFQDAEFVVEEAMLGSMRLPLQGQFEERDNVLTNVVIHHRGNRVRVGSGFSAEDRIRFGKDPSLIVGKTITVQYFEESQPMGTAVAAAAEGDGVIVQTDDAGAVWSLRFPTVKAIYDKGPRQI